MLHWEGKTGQPSRRRKGVMDQLWIISCDHMADWELRFGHHHPASWELYHIITSPEKIKIQNLKCGFYQMLKDPNLNCGKSATICLSPFCRNLFILLMVSFDTHVFNFYEVQSEVIQIYTIVSLQFSLRFRIVIHFESIIVCGVRQGLKFILLHVDIQLSSTTYWKDCPSPLNGSGTLVDNHLAQV